MQYQSVAGASSMGSPDGQDSSEGKSQGAARKANSQRPSFSCLECARRKTKCDKVVPCAQCVKRGKSHLCHIEPFPGTKPKATDPSPATSQLPAPIVGPDATRQAVFTDITEIRTTVDLLRSRIQGLEGLLANALNQPPAAATVAAQPHVSQQRQQPNHFEYIQPARPQYPQDPLPFLAPNEPCSAPQGFRPIDGTAAPIHDHHTSGVTSNRVDATMDGGRQAEEELEASVALEFLALGRHRTFGVTSTANTLDEGQKLPDGAQSIGQRQNGVHNSATPATYSQRLNGHASPSHHTAPPTSYPTLPYAIFPTAASLADCLPPQQQGSIILTHSLEQLAWHHGAVHAPSFSREVEEFWSWSSSGEKRVEVCNPAWLALFFAMLVVGVGNLAPGMAEVLGLTEDDQSQYAKRWFDASMAALYRSNFIQNHTIFSIQAITVLVVSGQDAAGPNLIPTLLTIGISSAQELGLHRMTSDEEWERQVRDAPQEIRVKSLIGRETRKRIFWSLTTQDWFRTPLQKIYVVQPTQVTTPLPANAHDEDLLTGQLVNRPPSQYTVVSKVLVWIQIARCLQSIFEHIDTHASSPSYEFLLRVDERLNAILSNAPAWLKPGGPTEGMPTCVDWVRTTFLISSNHKMLTLHRPFLHRAFQDPRYETSRRRAIIASRTILREAARCGSSIFRLWTIPYHVTAAACIILLDLFQRAGSASSAIPLHEERGEVEGALTALQSMQEVSSVAKRGVALISTLLVEERRLREERAREGIGAAAGMDGEGGSRGVKRRYGVSMDGTGGEYTQAAKKMAHELASPAPSSSASTPSSEQLQHPSPAYATSFDCGGVSQLELPHEFMSTFVDSGSDWGLGFPTQPLPPQNPHFNGFGDTAGGGELNVTGASLMEPFEIDSHYWGQ